MKQERYPLEPEGTAVGTQNCFAYLKNAVRYFIRWGCTLECDRALTTCGRNRRKLSGMSKMIMNRM